MSGSQAVVPSGGGISYEDLTLENSNVVLGSEDNQGEEIHLSFRVNDDASRKIWSYDVETCWASSGSCDVNGPYVSSYISLFDIPLEEGTHTGSPPLVGYGDFNSTDNFTLELQKQ